MTVSGEPGDIYDVQVSSDLNTWQTVAGLVNIKGSVVYIDPTSADSNVRFYRVVLKSK